MAGLRAGGTSEEGKLQTEGKTHAEHTTVTGTPVLLLPWHLREGTGARTAAPSSSVC